MYASNPFCREVNGLFSNLLIFYIMKLINSTDRLSFGTRNGFVSYKGKMATYIAIGTFLTVIAIVISIYQALANKH